jgi:hypothetical protein
MNTFILILTIKTGYGTALDHIAFKTEQSCFNAGEQWVKQNSSLTRRTKFICVSNG